MVYITRSIQYTIQILYNILYCIKRGYNQVALIYTDVTMHYTTHLPNNADKVYRIPTIKEVHNIVILLCRIYSSTTKHFVKCGVIHVARCEMSSGNLEGNICSFISFPLKLN